MLIVFYSLENFLFAFVRYALHKLAVHFRCHKNWSCLVRKAQKKMVIMRYSVTVMKFIRITNTTTNTTTTTIPTKSMVINLLRVWQNKQSIEIQSDSPNILKVFCFLSPSLSFLLSLSQCSIMICLCRWFIRWLLDKSEQKQHGIWQRTTYKRATIDIPCRTKKDTIRIRY